MVSTTLYTIIDDTRYLLYALLVSGFYIRYSDIILQHFMYKSAAWLSIVTQRGKTMKFFIGISIGVAAGVAVASYLLSQEGGDLRAKTLDCCKNMYSQMQSHMQDAIEQGKETYNNVKQELTEGYAQVN